MAKEDKTSKDPVVKLLNETKELLEDKRVSSIIAGVAIGCLAHDYLEKNPRVRDGILGALSGETVNRLLGNGKD